MSIASKFARHAFVLGLVCACGNSISGTPGSGGSGGSGSSGNNAGASAGAGGTSAKGGSSGGLAVSGTGGGTPAGGAPFEGMSGEGGAAGSSNPTDPSGASGMSSDEQAGTSGVAGAAGGVGGAAGNAGSGGGTAGNAGSSGAGGAVPCTCEAGKGCIQVTATRAAVPKLIPWERWPTMSDGKGSLVASALNGGSLAALKSLNDTDFTTPDPSYTINLCVAPGSGLTVRVHLDDDGDTPEYSSSDYKDFCGSGEGTACPRCMKATVAAGETVKLDYLLDQSCD